ncbi:MAG: hypothetical protein RLY45_1818, partial [Actinomycetota bacterium]
MGVDQTVARRRAPSTMTEPMASRPRAMMVIVRFEPV